MRAVAMVCVLLASGCDGVFGVDREILDAPVTDATDGIDAVDANRGRCLGLNGPGRTGLIEICESDLSTIAMSLAPTVTMLDTGNGCPNVVGDVCVYAYEVVSIATSLRVTGPRPLVIASFSRLTLGQSLTLDVSSRAQPQATGPGANASACAVAAMPQSGAGGAGGSFGTAGGAGGASGNGTTTTAATPQSPTALRGGCPGGTGARSSGAIGGEGGAGGGAVILLAASSMTIYGSINASGEGGRGGSTGIHGGGGGGSGGLIAFDAPDVFLTAMSNLYANGGGGGGGGGSTTAGYAGGESSSAMTPAMGGIGALSTPRGGDGGAGFAAGQAAAAGATQPLGAGGGGGGGGAGFIGVYAGIKMVRGTASPAVTAP